MHWRALQFISLILLVSSCSTINKKDCSKDMHALGLSQGKSGSSKIYTDDLRTVCQNKTPHIDLEGYEKGFYQGWSEYCLPNKAYEMGKRGDHYISFCPSEQEALFREKYLVGKHYFELKDVESEILEKREEVKPTINTNSSSFDEYTKLQQELDKVRRDMQALEVEGLKSSFKFR